MTSAVKMSEAELQDAVIDLARLLGWRVAHFRAARTADGGWRTAVSTDGAGFPDLVLAHVRHGVIFAELKSATGRVRPDQETWINTLAMAGAHATVWRPSHWRDGTIERVLRGGA